jgi:PAS domain S-box-containing protein
MIVVSATLFTSTFIFSLYRKMKYLKYFAFSYLLFFISYSLLSVQNMDNLFFSSVISNTALMGGYLMFYASFKQYFDKENAFPIRFWLYAVSSFAISYVFGIMTYEYFIRNILMGILTVLIFLDFGVYIIAHRKLMTQFLRGAIYTSLLTNIITNALRPLLGLYLLSSTSLPVDSQILNAFVFTSYSVTSIFWFATLIIMDGDLMNKATQKNEEKYLSLVESINSAIILVEEGGEITYMNQNAHTLFVGVDLVNLSDINSLVQSINANEILGLMDRVRLEKNSLSIELELNIFHDNHLFEIDVHPVSDSKRLYAILVSFTDISNQKRIEKQIIQSEENYKSMFFSSAEGKLLLDKDIIIECNEIAAKLLKSTREQVIGLSLNDITPEFQPDGRNSMEVGLEILEKTSQEGVAYFDFAHQALDGSEVIFKVSIIIISFDNHPVSLITWQDITAQKEVEINMLKLTRAVEQSPVSIVITDKDGNIEYANPKASETTGYTFEELKGQNPRILQSGFTSPDEYSQLWHEVTSGGQWKGLFHNKRKNGETYWESSSISPVFDAFGNITNYIAIKEDITERKSIEESLLINQNRLEQIAKNSRTVIWEMDAQGFYTYINEVCDELYGYKSDEIIGQQRDLFTPLVSNHKLDYEAIGFDRLKSGSAISGYENKIVRKDGSTIWVSTSATPIFNDVNEITGFIGSDNDINERKIAEDEFRKFKTMADQATYGNAIVSMDGNLIYVNEAFAKMQGYTIDEMNGMNLMYLHPESQHERVQELLGLIQSEGGFAAEELDFKRKDQSHYPSLMSASLIVDAQNTPLFMSASIIDISEIKIKEKEITKLSLAIEQSPVIVLITDLKGVIQYVNPAFETITGYSADEVIGQHTRMLQSGLTSKKVYQDLWKTILLGKVWKGEWINKRKDGELFYESVIVTPVKDENQRVSYYLAVKESITQRKQIEEALIKSEEQFRTLFTHSPIGMIIHDKDEGDILDCNPESLSILGLDSKDQIEEFIFHNDIYGFFNNYLNKVKEVEKQGLIQLEGKLRKATNEDIWVKVSLSLIEIGGIKRVLSISMDISKEKQAESDKIARQVAEESSRVKSIFFSNMSHEIRTPLNAINGFAQILSRDETLNSKQKEQIKTIYQSGKHLIALINDILDISKIEAGRLTVIEHDFNLLNMLKDIQMMFSLNARDKNLTFEFDVAHNVPTHIISDESKIRQVLINLIGNAIKFTSIGGVRVNVQLDPNNSESLQFDVIDTGQGLAPNELPHLFDPFWQSSFSHSAGGTGLGLPISKNIVEILGGTIRVKSELNKGSQFSFSVIIKPSSNETINKNTEASPIFYVEPNKYRICVVDDHEDNRRVLKELLEPIGFMIEECKDGEAAIQSFLTWQPHIILMDMRMPNIDGFEAIRQIRQLPSGHKVHIIGITASVFDEELTTVLKVGANHVLTKPLNDVELLTLLSKVPHIKVIRGQDTMIESLLDIKHSLHSQVPDSLKEEMIDAIEHGNMVTLRKLAHDVKKYSESVSQEILNLARNYDYEQLNALFKGMEDKNHE